MRQHTVPTFYLKGFVDPASAQSKDPYLWVVDIEEKRVYRRAPENVGRKSGFYDWEDLLNVPGYEEHLSLIETRAAKVFRKLRSGEFNLSNKEKYHLCYFIAFQISRTERFRNNINTGVTENIKKKIQNLTQDSDQIQSALNEYPNCDKDSLSVKDIRIFIEKDEFSINVKKDFLMGVAIELALKLIPVVGATKWSIFLSPGKQGFVTTDQGIAMLTHDSSTPDIDFINFINPKLEILVPISNKFALLMHQKGLPEDILKLDEGLMEVVLLSMLPTAERYVYTSSEQDANWVLENRVS